MAIVIEAQKRADGRAAAGLAEDGDAALNIVVEEVMKVDLEASGHRSDTAGLDADDDAGRAAAGKAENRMESAIDMPLSKLKAMLAESDCRPTTPVLAMAAMLRSKDEHPAQSEHRCDQNHAFEHFLVAGCDDYPEAMERLLGQDPCNTLPTTPD